MWRAGLILSLVVAVTLAANASAAGVPQHKICQAIAVSNHLQIETTCPAKTTSALSFTVPAKAPAGFQSTIAYTIIDNKSDAQEAWQYDAANGVETTLPAAGKVPNLPEPSHLYLAPGQDDAEATAFVGMTIVDVILVPSGSKVNTAALKSGVETILRNAAAVVRMDDSQALG
jgi:hypothetical protein